MGRNKQRSSRSFPESHRSLTFSIVPMLSYQIDLFRKMSDLSAQMVTAAQSQDWDRLVVLEQAVSALRDSLMADCDDASLTPDQLGAKAALIQQILDNDAEIRRHTEPWMEHVRQFLGDGARKRQVERAYGANPL